MWAYVLVYAWSNMGVFLCIPGHVDVKVYTCRWVYLNVSVWLCALMYLSHPGKKYPSLAAAPGSGPLRGTLPE